MKLSKGETRGLAKLLMRTNDAGLDELRIERDVQADLIVTTVHSGKRAEQLRAAGTHHFYIGPRGRVEETGPPAIAEPAP